MNTAWHLRDMAVFDVESTGVDVENDRIVQAAWLVVGPDGVVSQESWLVDPGVDIPAEATAIHGITTARARAEGVAPGPVVTELAKRVETAWAAGTPLVIFNAPFDLAMLDRELRRHAGGRGLRFPGALVVDPLVLDRACSMHRNHVKGGSRKLSDLAEHYRVRQDGAHDAGADCLTTARVAWRIARAYRLVGEMSPGQLMAFQAQANVAWAVNTETYLRTQKGMPSAVVDPSWPWRPPPTKGEPV